MPGHFKAAWRIFSGKEPASLAERTFRIRKDLRILAESHVRA